MGVACLQGLAAVMARAANGFTPDDLAGLSGELVTCRTWVQEAFQASTSRDLWAIVEKLKARQPLTQPEQDLVRLWMVGDAEIYVRLENNYRDWQAEYHRLAEVLGDYAGKALDGRELMNLHGLLTDALRVTADISFYQEEKSRIDRFEAAMRSLSSEDAELLVRLLTDKLQAAEF
jgi:hypothetical protein